MSKSILVVDDQNEILMVLGDMLSAIDYSYKIYAAHSVEEALHKFNNQKCDLVITDIMMPGSSGFDLIRELRDISPETKILSMTGKAGFKSDAEAQKIAKSMNADDILQKPFEFYDLADKVKTLLNN